MLKKSLSLLALAFFALLSVGCCPNQRMNITVELDDAMKQRLTELDVHAVRRSVRARPDVRDAPLVLHHGAITNRRRRDGQHPPCVMANHSSNAPVRDPCRVGS